MNVRKIISINGTYTTTAEVVPGSNVELIGGGIYMASVILGSIDPVVIAQIRILSSDETALKTRFCNYGNSATFLLSPNTDCEIRLYLTMTSNTTISGDFRFDSFSVIRIK